MARTRGASNTLDLDEPDLPDDGDVLVTVELPPEPVPPPPPATFYCTSKTADRNMEASELFEIMSLGLGGFQLEVSAEVFSTLRADVRRHFRPVV